MTASAPPMYSTYFLAEGTRGSLAQAFYSWQGIGSPNPQVFALGVKELWETKRPLDRVIHTMGWPLPRDAFGGSWLYPMEPNLVSLGLVVGLDYRDATLDVICEKIIEAIPPGWQYPEVCGRPGHGPW